MPTNDERHKSPVVEPAERNNAGRKPPVRAGEKEEGVPFPKSAPQQSPRREE
ncbi:hypothetical protein C8P63_10955 [Melghirimyces profundicolus]|uniref:Uncharacterized protein n=1 Tax=Melghirimyces profundicolus TaxID=1242148 RepID=A0A2T6BW46_9BACL|nr:hypothetical protein [Melghirimyces profundicolus]PTX60291.1 hypothetical protein C8P63_10955 [Melghirimyces profundicolus]